MTGLLDGRVVVVTGAGRGIGAGVARVLAREGARVVVNDLGAALDGSGVDTGPAATVAGEIRAAGGEAVANTNDIADYDGARELVEQAVDTYGKLDVVVNVAGILRDRMIFNLPPEDWDAVIRVHLRGTYNTTHHASRYWRGLRRPDGHFRLINFTSGSGMHGVAGQPNYAAAKMGIVGLTYSCANALAKYGVTVNAISPAAATRMGESIPNQESRSEALRSGSGEMAPENVAPMVAYLASERSDWCTGQVFLAAGYLIGMYNVPEVTHEIVSPGPWDLRTAFHMIENMFQPNAPVNRLPKVGTGIEALQAELASTGGPA
ncbi:NAD(P)-dependent dehydrogenase, short-chain alcohol dehydrogenase family [Pseudonocardia thermophila]|jgi:Dehydrogenases with different specificities (related to short-chain alcohol dehydrogenases)|uniref:NAD(P)-dependent dehydrogenase, short-chain alcohol dehydrogenase family n=1 Tax=Pseudonocardia thermophila TaxID=1848 RepID=A0A1M6XQB9_PSETH|nr:SDR family NAD(P)-dependent oxidoreductase [Pseudonocardia thermophila]SHL07995.1 NAD(P)-dependent dehydrogenase, short-chain alcohol dehydrogenase family [Pseudonocardia thermophila]